MLTADLQAVINDPLVTQNSETITMVGRDVGVPIINLLNWTTIANTDVDVDQIIFPDNPLLPGGRTVQICVVAGHTSTEEPVFSDISGDITVDGTAQWSSIGDQRAVEGAQDWVCRHQCAPRHYHSAAAPALDHVASGGKAGTEPVPKAGVQCIPQSDRAGHQRHLLCLHAGRAHHNR